MFFSDLSSDSARDLFKEFVVEWNKKELEPRYYDGIAAAPRTSHNWNIKKQYKFNQLYLYFIFLFSSNVIPKFESYKNSDYSTLCISGSMLCNQLALYFCGCGENAINIQIDT